MVTPLILLTLMGSAVRGDDMEKTFKDNQIIPDVIDVVPMSLLKVTYPSGASVDLGKELTPNQVKDLPKLEWEANDNDFYTLLFVDPDAPSRTNPMFREVRHWNVVNIPGNKLEQGETIIEFIGSGPPKDTGLHRYIFLLFKQKNGKITVDGPRTSNRSRKNRFQTKVSEFVKKYDLGELVAGNFYQAQFDDYVPLLHAQLSED